MWTQADRPALMRRLLGVTVATAACLLLAVVLDKTPAAVLAQRQGLACGRGGPCPAGPAFIYKAGLTSAAERAWAKVSPGLELSLFSVRGLRRLQDIARALAADARSTMPLLRTY